MFRHERPQKGRYRQFHQIGVETFGLEGPDIDLELILITARLWRELGLDGLELQLNTLGTAEERTRYREVLVDYLKGRHEELDEDSRRRLDGNPLRILDTKNPDVITSYSIHYTKLYDIYSIFITAGGICAFLIFICIIVCFLSFGNG